MVPRDIRVGLDHLHKLGNVHDDVNPTMLDDDGYVIITSSKTSC